MPRQLGKYQLLKSIATGGMAEIHVAKQLGIEGFEKLVVIKLLQPEMAKNQAAVDLFLNEARLAARLAHPNVVQIFDLGAADNEYYIAMEYVHGENLVAIAKAFKKQKKLMSLEQILNIVCAVLEGLNYAHTQTDQLGNPLNIVHCDVSPHNILVSFQGVVKLVDFGIAKVASRFGKTETDLVAGKLAYMSPQQAQGLPLDARTDLFSLGIVLWELTAGRRLYGRRPAAEILELLKSQDIPSPRHVNPLFPNDLEPIVMKSVAREPADRFQSAYEMHTALTRFMKTKGMSQSTMELSGVMQDLFRHKLDSVKRIEQAQQSGEGLEDQLFDGINFDDAMTDPGSPAEPEASAPITISERRFTASLPTTSISTNPRPPRRAFPWKVVVLLLVLAGAGVAIWMYQTQLLAWGQRLLGTDEKPEVAKELVTVRLETKPTGAKVTREGGRTCTAPCVFTKLEVGVEHTFHASLAGYETETLTWKADKDNGVEILNMALSKQGPRGFGRLVVSTEPPGAKVELDGKPVDGVTPLTIHKVSAGRKHWLRAIMAGRLDWKKSFTLRTGQELALDGKLASTLGQGKALLTLESTPRALVFVDGKKSGRTPINGLLIKAGTHMIELKHPDTKWTESLIIDAGEGEHLREKVTFPKGKLVAEANPKADVIIAGKRIGTTPLEHDLVAGTYQITFANFAKKLSKQQKVVIKPKQTTRVKVSLVE